MKDINITKNKILYISLLIIYLLILIIGFTYAYLIDKFEGNTNQYIALKNIDIEYIDGESITSNEFELPMNEDEVLSYAPKHLFSVKNNYSNSIYLKIKLADLNITSETKKMFDDSNFRYILYKGNEKIEAGNLTGYDEDKNEITLLSNYEQAANTTVEYTIYIWIRDNGGNQNHFLNQNMSGKIKIEGYEKQLPTLVSNILNNNKISEKTPNFNNIATTDEELIKGLDSDGETYYFRGNVEDNYVKFGIWNEDNKVYYAKGYPSYKGNTKKEIIDACNGEMYQAGGYTTKEDCVNDIVSNGSTIGESMIWRIVRINGDGTVRLMLNESINNIQLNNIYDEKYIGYTYDNSNPNIQDGTPNNIKTILDNWYTKNLSKNDKIIANTRYCNDTSVYKTEEEYNNIITYYGANERLKIDNLNPTFICPKTTKTYGGEYDLKIGLLSADEAVFAGANNNISNTDYYLYKNKEFWTNTPDNSSNNGNVSFFINDYVSSSPNVNMKYIFPVINIKADVLAPTGNGTSEDPYLLEY